MHKPTVNVAATSNRFVTRKHSGGNDESVSSPPVKSFSSGPPSSPIVTTPAAPNPAASRLIISTTTGATVSDGNSDVYLTVKDQMTLPSLITFKMTSLAQTCLRTAIVVATHLHSHGATPIHLAVIRGISDEWLDRLLWAHRFAASVQDRTNSLTPLQVALRYSHTSLKAVQLLVCAQPLCVGIRCKKGHLPIHIAAQHSTSVEIVCYLLTSLPESVRSLTGDYGDTPLHLAARADNDRGDEVVLNLVDWAPDLSMKRNRIDETPFSIVCGLWDAFVSSPVGGDRIREIFMRGDTGSTMKSSGLFKRLWNKMSYLAKARYCTISSRAVSQNTLISDIHLLHAAVGSSCPSSFVELVLRLYPSQIDQIDRTGQSPLSIAAATTFRSDVEGLRIIDCLLSACPEYAAVRDRNDNYPLHLALGSEKTWDFGVRRIFEAFPHAIENVDVVSGLPSFLFATSAKSTGPCHKSTAAHGFSDIQSENFVSSRRRFSVRRARIIPQNDSFDEYMQGAPLQSLLSKNASLQSWDTDLDLDGADSGSDSEGEVEEGRDQPECHRQVTACSICTNSEPRDVQADQIETVYRLIRASPSVLRTKLTSRLQSES